MLPTDPLDNTPRPTPRFLIQPDRINMALLFWLLVKSDTIVLATVHCTVAYTEQVTSYKAPKTHGNV